MSITNASTERHSKRSVLSTVVSTPMRWLTRLFGCWHGKMNNPFTQNEETYRTCMSCGARRHFNAERAKMTGAYYYVLPSALYVSPPPRPAFAVKKD